MNISTVNELIQSLESAGELSIREQKFLKLAKAYQQLAAENVALKEEISNITFMRDDDFFGSTQRAQEVMGRLVNVKTPATDRIVAGIKADGVEEWVSSRGGRWNGTTEEALKFAKHLREGKSEEVKS
ncbi:hypothetical protein [Raoultella ornithinolytica]|uniref:hypothetical protein n=1 Tax=Raoultella ornithinolytica TaxID=54291 RepID=UPI0004D4F74E|nr:hypothetical protein [Raoultella ornithinolytica]KDV95762.1 hypothetical protein AB00_1363 [Raoultella ornithinolytica 2-156-04_S1_C1]KDX15279.1 hypothetical protein AB28_1376 [Raoultella ornithinolytica 2-156-04_S1_C2]